jgi:hypothetical protein
MTRVARPRKRPGGAIDTLRSGAVRVRVYASMHPLTERRHDLVEVILPGPDAARETEEARTRLLSQVDERRDPRSKAGPARRGRVRRRRRAAGRADRRPRGGLVAGPDGRGYR